MKTITSWNDLLEVAHPEAKAKGWWDNPDRPIDEQVANFHAEISEAWEEYRAGRMETWYSASGEKAQLEARNSEGCPGWYHEETGDWLAIKPEGFWVEIGDLLVRLADTCGRYGLPVVIKDSQGEKRAPAELVCELHYLVADSQFWFAAEDWASSMESAEEIVRKCVTTAKRHGVNLWPIVNEKVAYNRTRSHRHGNKAA